MGWLRKISRDFKHSPRISASVSWTFFPGREPRTEGGVEKGGGGGREGGGEEKHIFNWYKYRTATTNVSL